MGQWVGHPTRNRWMPVSREFKPHIKGSRGVLEQETLTSLHRTGWFQERIQAQFTFAKKCLFHN